MALSRPVMAEAAMTWVAVHTTEPPDAQSVPVPTPQRRLGWAEDYFTKKGAVPDAVKLARQGEELAATLGKSIASSDFDGALATYDSLVKTCRACHDAYKPPDL